MMDRLVADDLLPAQRGGAKALLLTVLGEFVLPSGGSVWTSTLVSAADALGIGEKNARQALARIADEGLIESSRHGRRVRWGLTPAGRELLESGAARIYSFGNAYENWDRQWLVAHCPVPELQRALRNQLRTRLAFLGFGEISASLMISPHLEREAALRDTLEQLGLSDDCTVLRSTTESPDADTDLAARAWELDALADDYRVFSGRVRQRRPSGGAETFAATVELVDDWRRFPFVDPELPGVLLPERWEGAIATADFREFRAVWSPVAQTWFSGLEAPVANASG